MAIPDRRPPEVGKGRGEDSITGRAARPVENRSRAEAYGARTDSDPGALGGCNALVHLPYRHVRLARDYYSNACSSYHLQS
jgi:hypothetical protein